MFVACQDERGMEIADKGFGILHKITERHFNISDVEFGIATKGEVLGLIMDDMSKRITDPERY